MIELRNIRLTLEYDGTEFHGWQVQRDSRTVQGVVEDSLLRLLGERHRVVGTSRTDAGAHARGQVASFLTRSSLPSLRIKAGLNALLPEDVAVRESVEVPPEFNARRSARSRTYSYCIVVGDSVLWRRYAWMLRKPLNLSVMEEATRGIIGLKDFRALSGTPEPNKSTLCMVLRCAWTEWSEGYRFEIEADRFLRHMVRTIVGTAVRVGEGKADQMELARALESSVRPLRAITAPARGLCLESVSYGIMEDSVG